ncbi:MAG TPA: hypothetical protein VLJ37_04650 [bacterium]|nr:hypothetical protein [bacterium]
MRKINGFLAACALTLAAGCGGSNGGSSDNLNLPAGTNALLSVYVSGSGPAALTLDAGGKTVEITTALMGLSEVKLRTASTTDTEATELSLPGPFIVDLEAQTVENLGPSHIDDDADDDGIEDSKDSDDDGDGTPDVSDSDDDGDGVADEDDYVMDECSIVDALELPAGTYTKIEAKLDKIEDGDGIDPASPLAGKSLYIEGTFDGTPFVVTADFDEEFEVVNPAGIVVEDGSIASFILSFNLAGWFEGIDLSAAETEGGIVLLDSGHNSALFEQFRDNVKATMDMENDSDDDGIPDSED